MNTKLLHTPEGVRDIYGKELAKKEAIELLLQNELSLYGYQKIQTPTFEYFDVFSNEIGTTPSKELYKFFDREGETLVLRPDFTPSVARFAARYFRDAREPLRLSYMGNAFQNGLHLRGRLKETTQIGAEFLGDASARADAEIIALLISCLLQCGLRDFQVTLGNADYFRGLCEQAGLAEETEETLRTLVKAKNYFAAKELLEGCGTSGENAEALLKCADMFGGLQTIEEARALVKNDKSLRALDRLKEVYELLRLYGAEQYVGFDFSLLSKYHYYTGIIFKAYTYGIGDAVVTGGRYDGLLSLFYAAEERGRNDGERKQGRAPAGKESALQNRFAAVGFMIVVDDLLNALTRQGIRIDTDDAYTVLEYTDDTYEEKLKEALSLRAQGIRVAFNRKEEV